MHSVLVLARNEALNKWLGEHPMVLGGIFLLIGLAVGGWGVSELMAGVSYDKKGRPMEGGAGKAVSLIRVVAGAGCLIFGAYKMFS